MAKWTIALVAGRETRAAVIEPQRSHRAGYVFEEAVRRMGRVSRTTPPVDIALEPVYAHNEMRAARRGSGTDAPLQAATTRSDARRDPGALCQPMAAARTGKGVGERLNSGQARMIRRPDEASNRRHEVARTTAARLDTRLKHPDGPEASISPRPPRAPLRALRALSAWPRAPEAPPHVP